MHPTIYEGLSYHIHLLKSRVLDLGVIFLNTELNKPTFLCYEMSFIHYLLQIKQNVYSIDIFPASVVTQFIVKYKEK